jgi:hypothetical protein
MNIGKTIEKHTHYVWSNTLESRIIDINDHNSEKLSKLLHVGFLKIQAFGELADLVRISSSDTSRNRSI